MVSRRTLIGGLGASYALSGCAALKPSHRALNPAIYLGWRWVAGASHAFQLRTVRETSTLYLSRVERWRYDVLSVSNEGVAELKGMLTGSGLAFRVNGVAIKGEQLERARRENEAQIKPVRLAISVDGRIHGCSESRFYRASPHHLLQGRFPSHGVHPGDSWLDQEWMFLLSALVPKGFAVSVSGHTTLLSIERRRAHLWASLSSSAQLIGGEGFGIHLTGECLWDGVLGGPIKRTIHLHVEPQSADPALDPGQLTLYLERIGESSGWAHVGA